MEREMTDEQHAAHIRELARDLKAAITLARGAGISISSSITLSRGPLMPTYDFFEYVINNQDEEDTCGLRISKSL